MKLIERYIRFLLITLAVNWLGLPHCYSQGTDWETRFKNGFYLGVCAGPSNNKITCEGKLTSTGVITSNGTTFSGSIDAGYLFPGGFGLSTGLSYSRYSTQLSLGEYASTYDTTDSENETYERQITGRNLSEIQDISFFSIPFRMHIQIPLGSNIGLYLQTGISLSFPMEKSYNSSGTFTYKGYYPSYNVTFSDIPYEGFKSNVVNNVDGELKLKSMITEFISSAGFQFLIQKKLQFSAGVFYNRVLSELSAYESNSSFQLSSIENNLNSMMEGSDKVSASSMGISLSLRYFLKK